jgi:hypothetical protein
MSDGREGDSGKVEQWITVTQLIRCRAISSVWLRAMRGGSTGPRWRGEGKDSRIEYNLAAFDRWRAEREGRRGGGVGRILERRGSR